MNIILKENDESEQFIEELILRTKQEVIASIKDMLQEFMGQIDPDKERKEWMSGKEVMDLLDLTCPKQLLELRNNKRQNGLVISQLSKRKYIYNRGSIYNHINRHLI